mgnify:CR=1 FL=1
MPLAPKLSDAEMTQRKVVAALLRKLATQVELNQINGCSITWDHKMTELPSYSITLKYAAEYLRLSSLPEDE